MSNVNGAHASPSGTHDGRNPLEFLNQHNVAAAPARGGATSSLDHELQRCLSSILTAPPGEQVRRAQSFKSAITKVREQLSPESLESYRQQFNTICAEMSRKKASRKLNRRPIEIQLRENHFVALLRRMEINEPWEAEVIVAEPEGESRVIQVKRKRFFKPYDQKFVAWDLECTGNGRDDGVHVCYAMGLAWEDQYASFWGLGSSIKQGLDFI